MAAGPDVHATEAGGLPDDWRAAFDGVPREPFLPDLVWDTDLRPVRRSTDPEAWSALVRGDTPVITQLDDGTGTGRGYVSSAASMPSIVATMLAALEVADGHRVLEIGTGTGWNAALLAARLGDAAVTTVEIDPAVAAHARRALAAADRRPRVVVGDGTAGRPEGAPYDRVLATAAVQRVPYAWVAQTRPGGRIVTPWGTAFHNGTLARLRVGADGTAEGRFGGDVGFMWVRGQRTPFGSVEDRVRADHAFEETTTTLHPHEPVGGFDASFAIGLRVPGMLSTVAHDGATDDHRFTVYLMDPGSGSWASWRVTPDTHGAYRVRSHGRRRLFEELADAYAWWRAAGRPAHDRFGLTITPDTQTVWLGTPSHPVAPPSA